MHHSRFHIGLLLMTLGVGTCVRVLAQEPPSETSPQQSAVAQTPAEQQLRRWVDTFNAGDRGSWQKFVAEHFPSKPPQEIDRDLALRARTGDSKSFFSPALAFRSPSRASARTSWSRRCGRKSPNA